MPTGQPYTFGIYTVKRGKEREFIDTWTKFVNWSLTQFKVGGYVRIAQDQENPQRYISYAEWVNYNDLNDWRERPEYNDYLNKLREFCDNVERILCKVVVDIPVGQQQRSKEEVKTKGR